MAQQDAQHPNCTRFMRPCCQLLVGRESSGLQPACPTPLPRPAVPKLPWSRVLVQGQGRAHRGAPDSTLLDQACSRVVQTASPCSGLHAATLLLLLPANMLDNWTASSQDASALLASDVAWCAYVQRELPGMSSLRPSKFEESLSGAECMQVQLPTMNRLLACCSDPYSARGTGAWHCPQHQGRAGTTPTSASPHPGPPGSPTRQHRCCPCLSEPAQGERLSGGEGWHAGLAGQPARGRTAGGVPGIQSQPGPRAQV